MARLKEIFERQITGEWGEDCVADRGIPVIRTTNFTDVGRIDFSNIASRSIEKHKATSKRLQCGDIILEKSGGTDKTPVGRVVFCDEDICNDHYICNNFTIALRVNRLVANDRYVFYYMFYLHKSGKTDLMQNKTTGIRNLQMTRYLDTEVPLPLLTEQRRIASLLDKANSLIALRKGQLELLDELVKARFIEMFGDPLEEKQLYQVERLSDIAEVKIGPFGSILHESDYIVNGIPVINPSNITNDKIIPNINHTVSQEKYVELSSYKLHLGDIVLGRRGEMGRCAIIETEGLLCGTGSLIIRSSPKMQPYILQKIISHPTYRNYIADMSVGVTMQNLNVKIVGDFPIPLYPLDLQEEFILFSKRIDQVRLEMLRGLDTMETSYSALLQEYFG